MLKLGLLVAFSSTALATPSLISRAGLKDCLTTAGLETYVPGDAGYANASAPYNLRLDPQPAGVTYPTTTAQVAAAIGCAKNNGVSITSRSGGHSYAGYSDQSGELVLDLKAFNSFSYDSNSQTATFGPGIRLGDLALALNENGRAMPHGTCPTVGSGGHIAHGGYGFYSRLWGLAMDRVIGHEVVLADGSVVQTSATQNPDLFWALKGAAPSYGVITSYTTTTEPVPHDNVQILITWDLTAQQAADAFIRWQTYLPNAPQELGFAFRMFKGQTSSTLRLDFVGQYKGTVDDLLATLGPQIDALPAPVSKTINAIDWIPLLEWLGGTPLNTSTGPHVTDTFYAKSLAVFEDAPMTATQALSLTNYLATTGLSTGLSWFAMADNWGGASAINSVPLDSTAFGSRSNLFGWQLYGFTPDSQPPFPADGIQFVQGIYNSIVDSADSGWKYNAYSNYVDPQLSRDEAHTLYYGSHVAKLESLKDQYDPQNVFAFPQSFLP